MGESLVKDILQNLTNSSGTRRDPRRRNGSSLLLSIFPKHLLRDANFTKQLAALTSYRSEIEGGYPTAGDIPTWIETTLQFDQLTETRPSAILITPS